LSLYLDASALLPLFIDEPKTQRAHELLRGNILVISDFAVAEFASGVARRARLGEINDSGASAAVDAWTVNAAKRENLTAGDVGFAISLIRRLDLGLRAPDAINIAIARRCEAQLLHRCIGRTSFWLVAGACYRSKQVGYVKSWC
jgi:predicted nucleic acid-binding protein